MLSPLDGSPLAERAIPYVGVFGADAVVMATHGRTGIQRAVLGSVTGTVLRAGPTPVLLVHPRGAPTDAAPAELTIPVEMGAVPTF